MTAWHMAACDSCWVWIIYAAVIIALVYFLIKWRIVESLINTLVEFLCRKVTDHSKLIQDLEHEVDEKTGKIARQNEEILHLNKTVEELKRQVEDYTNRLAHQMSKQMAADETSVEKVAIKNRPMNITDDYLMLCSNEWLDVKTAIDEFVTDQIDESDKVTFLCDILMLVETEAKSLHHDVYNTIMSPFSKLSPPVTPKKTSPLPLEVSNSVGDYLRNNSQLVDKEPFQELIRNKLDEVYKVTSTNNIWQLTKNEKEMTAYIQKVIDVVWNMVIQRPPMTFQAPKELKQIDNMDLAWGSDVQLHEMSTTPDVKISTVHPMLFHGTKLMAKGKCLVMKGTVTKPEPRDHADQGDNEDSHDGTPLIN